MLLTDADLRLATGVSSGRDDEHTALNKSVAAAITARCKVASGGVSPPTLLLETLTQTFRQKACADKLILARRPVTEIVSVTVDGTTTAAGDYEFDAATGVLLSLSSDSPSLWYGLKTTVVYKAGFADVPENLRLAAMKLANALWQSAVPEDPSAKRISIPGVIDIERWVSEGDDPLFSREIDELLSTYINYVIA